MASIKRVAVLGSTGSIGTSALDVIAAHPDRLSLIGVAAHSHIDLLEAQIARHRPRLAAVLDADRAGQLRQRLGGRTPIGSGVDGFIELATHPEVDLVVVGTAGPDALLPLMRAIEAGKQVALASKELLVMAGELIMQLVRRHGTVFLPIDSEHAAVAQLLRGVSHDQLERVILTGSGGPLWGLEPSQLARVSRAQVLNHPKWQMGQKITVDSATLMNKGLELIEAHWLFGLPFERLELVIHPQAAIHAMVELLDGTILAQMSLCDMRLPIQAAFSFPERWTSALPRLRLTALSGLEFLEPDPERFPCLQLARDAARQGGTACTVLSAANDMAVRAYLRDELAFPDIPAVIHETLRPHAAIAHPTLEQIVAADQWARRTAGELVHHKALRLVATES